MSGVNAEELVPTLRRNYLFAALGDAQLQRARQAMRVLQLQEGERLFDHGQHATRFFLLCSGQIKLFRLSADGMEKVIDIIHPGQTFAEAVMFMRGHSYPVNADALVASEVASFDNNAFLELLRESTETCFRLLGDMSQRLHALLNDIDHLTLQNATGRLLSYLACALPADAEGGTAIELNVPKSVLASRLSIQPETFSRILANLQRDGVLSVHGRVLRVADAGQLRRMVSTGER